jgi:hypothetical protein
LIAPLKIISRSADRTSWNGVQDDPRDPDPMILILSRDYEIGPRSSNAA